MLIQKAKRAVEELSLKIINSISPTTLVVGLSGGADSTLALIVAKHITTINPLYKVKAVHCIHGLDADDPIWFEHCKNLCQKLEVPLVTPKLNIVYGNGRSPEEVSRAERYRALLENLQGGALILGHQADDQIESFLLALKRGSGPYGLSGMRFKVVDERGTILRPLLELHKREIIEIIEALGFTHVFDISNTYMKFERNFIRLKVLPLLKERFKGVEGSILRSSKLCSYEHDLAMRFAKNALEQAVLQDDPLVLDITKLDTDDEALATAVIRLYLNQVLAMPPEFNQVLEVLNLCRISPDQKVDVSLDENYSVRRFKNCIYLVKNTVFEIPKDKLVLKVGESITLGNYVYSLEKTDGTDKVHTYHVNGEVVLDFNYVKSTVIKPVNRAHSREIKKLFVEHNLPTWQRDKEPLVKARDGTILGIGDLFVTTDNAQRAGENYLLKITLQS